MAVRQNIQPLVLQCKRMFQEGQSWEPVLRFLKKRTGSQILSIQVISETLNLPLDSAKCIVHFSETWTRVRTRNEKFHEEIATAVQQFPL